MGAGGGSISCSSIEKDAVGSGATVTSSDSSSVTNGEGADVGQEDGSLLEPSTDCNDFGSARLDPFLKAMTRPVARGTTRIPTANSKQHMFRILKMLPRFFTESSGETSTRVASISPS